MTLLQFWWHKFLFHLLPFSLFGWPLCLTIYKFFGDFVSQGSDVLLLFAHISITTVGEIKSVVQRWSWSHPTAFFSYILHMLEIFQNTVKPSKQGGWRNRANCPYLRGVCFADRSRLWRHLYDSTDSFQMYSNKNRRTFWFIRTLSHRRTKPELQSNGIPRKLSLFFNS